MHTYIKTWLIFTFVLLMLCTCNNNDEQDPEKETQGCGFTDVTLFSLQKDKQLGARLATEISKHPGEYPVLDSTSNTEAYSHIYRIMNNVLESGEVKHENDFNWQVKIIEKDSVMNAFAAPGGYLYFYTGLIKYLNSEDALAGVMAHEIAHADKRHGTKQMTKQYGLSILTDIILGEDSSQLVQIALGLSQLKNSRCHESEADEAAVIYLSEVPEYRCNGHKIFFEQMGSQGVPQFLSTHPNPENRVEAINEKAGALDCDTTQALKTRQYENFKQSLP